ncbi:hypothetical protein [Methylobacterium sp. JK268]
MKRLASLVAVPGLLGLGLLEAGPAEAWPTRTFEKVAVAGHPQKFASYTAVEENCTSAGAMTVHIIEPPGHGTLDVRYGRAYPNFPAYNPRSRCNTRQVPATLLSYTSAPDYRGEDEFVVEAVGPFGTPTEIRYHVTVR